MSATTILLMTLSLAWISASDGAMSHYVWIDRMEVNMINKDWVADNMTLSIKKGNKNEKLANVMLTILKDVGNDTECEMKVFQKMGPKFMKAPADFPKMSCCDFIANNSDIWPCVKKFSNFPDKCPIPKGTYEVKGLNANECELGFMLPPNLPEHYKVEFQSFQGSTRISRMIAYGTMKKKFAAF